MRQKKPQRLIRGRRRMTNNEEIVFDSTSGISVEEQKEILSKIDGIAEKNRRQLSQGDGKTAVVAKKTGALFPVLFNITAVVILVTGVVSLFSFNARKDTQIREGTKVYSVPERALIEEIRRETAQKIASKENEIESIRSRLLDVGSQLEQLYSNNQTLSKEQLAAESRLLALQKNYRDELSASEGERARILEDSRSRESRVRSQIESKTGGIDAAQEETALEQLSRDQERASAIDAQLSGGLAAVSGYVKKDEFDEASRTIGNLRLFLETPSFQSIQTFQSRKEFYLQAINSVDVMIEDIRIRGGGIAVSQPQDSDKSDNSGKLEETIAEMQKTIDAFSSGSSGQAARLKELEQTIKSLESEKSSLINTITARDETIKDMASQGTTKEQRITELETKIKNLNEEALRIFGSQ